MGNKAIILCGGFGSRLRPMTCATNKHLLPIAGKPMVYYPLALAIEAGFTNILISTNADHVDDFSKLLGDGGEFGITISYGTQEGKGKGIAGAIGNAWRFVDNDPFAVFLGDNVIFGDNVASNIRKGFDAVQMAAHINASRCSIYTYFVPNPHEFGVINQSKTRIVEKPKNPETHDAVCGIYMYTKNAITIAQKLEPSPRGETEVTDLNNAYLNAGVCDVVNLSSTGALWLDTGNPYSMRLGTNVISGLEELSNRLIGSPHIAAYKSGLIDMSPDHFYETRFEGTEYATRSDSHLKQMR